MSDGLEDLFLQILNSEQKVHHWTSVVNKVKEAVQQCQRDICDAEIEQKSLQGQLVTEVQQWNDVELERKVFSSREVILQGILEDTKGKVMENKKRLAEVKAHRESMYEDFTSSVDDFTRCFDLTNHVHRRWQNKLDETLDNLRTIREQLRGELAVLENQQSSYKALQNDVAVAKEELQRMPSQLSETQKILATESESTRTLEKQRRHISDIPNTSKDFKRLRAELQKCKEDSLEDYCASLQVQVEDLKKKRWQGNMKPGSSLNKYQTPAGAPRSVGASIAQPDPVEADRTNARRFTNFQTSNRRPNNGK